MFRVFSAFFRCFSRMFFLGSRGVKILGVLGGFLGFYLNTKEWKIRVVSILCAIEIAWFPSEGLALMSFWRTLESRKFPKGPKIEKIQDRPPGLKFSIEIENFKRATQQTPILWGILKVWD